jgi:hypothetical protein
MGDGQDSFKQLARPGCNKASAVIMDTDTFSFFSCVRFCSPKHLCTVEGLVQGPSGEMEAAVELVDSRSDLNLINLRFPDSTNII